MQENITWWLRIWDMGSVLVSQGWFGFGLVGFSWLMIHFLVPALCPSKSGLMNKHIVKHIVRLPRDCDKLTWQRLSAEATSHQNLMC
jgi:hypothetical protein